MEYIHMTKFLTVGIANIKGIKIILNPMLLVWIQGYQ